MRWVLRIVGAFVAIILSLATIAGLQTPGFKIEASRVINAPPEVVFGMVAQIKKWNEWSPWYEKDNTIQTTYSGPDSGTGAKSAWTSKKSGSGEMTFTEVEPARRVKFQLIFNDFNATNTGEITLEPTAGGTKVTWMMEGKNPFVGRFFWLLLRVEKDLKKDFNRGLELLSKKF